jgi:hypothetical protein
MGRPASPRTEQAMSGPDLAHRTGAEDAFASAARVVIIVLAVATPAVCVVRCTLISGGVGLLVAVGG